MSLGGQEDSAAVIVYGPDGKAYGSPAQARAAGVSNPTMSAPASVPIQYPRLQPYTPTPLPSVPIQYPRLQPYTPTPLPSVPIQYPRLQPYTPTPLPSVPTPSSGERNRYAEIMSQFGQSQPFSFTGMPSGGFNPYAYDYTGGFTPYQRPIPAPALPVQQDQYSEIIRQLGGGGGYGSSPEGRAEREANFNNMTDAERAAHLATNEGIAEGLGLFGRLVVPFGFLGSNDNEGNSTGGPSRMTSPAAANAANAMNASIRSANIEGQGLAANPMSKDPSQGGNPAPTPQGAGAAPSDGGAPPSGAPSEGGNKGSGGAPSGGGAATGGRDTGGGTRDASGGGDRGTRGGFAQGGHVSMQHLLGPDPEGPDDGYAALKDGEYVINDKAVKKYGIELMHAINSGKISKGKLRGLLEM